MVLFDTTQHLSVEKVQATSRQFVAGIMASIDKYVATVFRDEDPETALAKLREQGLHRTADIIQAALMPELQ